MLQAIEGVGVLFLLSAFFAYVLAPLVVELRRRIRIGARKRPLSRAAALAVIYALLFIPTTAAWRLAGDRELSAVVDTPWRRRADHGHCAVEGSRRGSRVHR